MHVRLLKGSFGSPDGFATNDFETLATGDITDANYTFTSTNTNGGCYWEIAEFGTRINA